MFDWMGYYTTGYFVYMACSLNTHVSAMILIDGYKFRPILVFTSWLVWPVSVIINMVMLVVSITQRGSPAMNDARCMLNKNKKGED